jgi:NADH:ubiquinone oxidoreductase subunit 3 (subunit A)
MKRSAGEGLGLIVLLACLPFIGLPLAGVVWCWRRWRRA